MNEDVNRVSPTLGFIIKTIDFQGCESIFCPTNGCPADCAFCSYKLNIWDVGGQKTIRSYWRNYFEKTDALIWVVDATDRLRMDDCKAELKGLLMEEVSLVCHSNRKRLVLTRASAWPVQVCWCFSTRPTWQVA